MISKLFYSIFLYIFLSIFLTSQAATKEAVYHIDASIMPVINIKINGEKFRFLVYLSLPDILIVNPSVVRKLGLKKSGFASMFAPTALVDDKKLQSKAAKVNIEIEGLKKEKGYVYWFDEPYWNAFDGVVGPSGLSVDIIEFTLNQDLSSLDKRETKTIKLKSSTAWDIKVPLADHKIGIFARIKLHYMKTRSNIRGTRLLEYLDLARPVSSYVDVKRVFNVSAKAATYHLKSPIRIFGVPINSFLGQVSLKTAETRNQGIEEIIVMAKSRKKKKDVSPEIFLGRDAFSKCLKMIFSRKLETLKIICHQ